MVLKVRRFDPSTGSVRYDHYDVKHRPGMTVLDALLHVQERIDDSLSFRYSCRGAVCGSCAVLVNRVPRLACRTQLDAAMQGTDAVELKPDPTIGELESFNPRFEILVEPLPHFHVLKDLVVDFRKFFRFYEATEPVFRAPVGLPDRELRLEPAAAKELEVYTNCVLCGACFAACPVCGKNPNYWGPAALAKLYRFAIDPREPQDDRRWTQGNHPDGWPACEFFANCKLVCPKGVPPNLAIGAARRRLEGSGSEPLTTKTSEAAETEPPAPVPAEEPMPESPQRDAGDAASAPDEPPRGGEQSSVEQSMPAGDPKAEPTPDYPVVPEPGDSGTGEPNPV
jgi:succinate dehydrogenase / fumarate reductase iron-sulfur subunit